MTKHTQFKQVDESVVERFESSWLSGSPKTIQEVIDDAEDDLRVATLEELVHIDLEFHWNNGTADDGLLATYLEQFSQLGTTEIINGLVRQEMRLRIKHGAIVTIEHYRQRFPDFQINKSNNNPASTDTQHEIATIIGEPEDPQRNEPTAKLDLDGTIREQATVIGEVAALPVKGDASTGDFIETNDDSVLGIKSIPGYDFISELGRGGMGVVYKARDQRLKRTVAIKMIIAGAHAGEEEMARFQTEAQAVAKLNHHHIVEIFEVGEHNGKPYIALEYADGGSLEELTDGKPQTAEYSAMLVEMLAAAMQAAHDQDIIHRDLKPANILLDETGEPRITDFGLAKQMDEDSNQTKSGAVMGTPGYMAPEQAGSSPDTLGPATDTYAIGAILYHLLTGHAPFQAATPFDTIMQVLSDDPVPPRRLVPTVPIDLETICLKCLQKEPHRRYTTAQELAEDLRRQQAGEPILARPVGTSERMWKWSRRHPAIASLIVVSLLALITIIGGGVWYNTLLTKQRDDANSNKTLAERREAEALKAKSTAENERNQAITARQRALIAEQQAKESLKLAEELAYGSSMLLANVDYHQGNLSRLRTNLKRYENRTDLQGFEWHYWNRRVNYRFLINQTEDHPAAKHISLPFSGPWNLGFSADGSEIRFTAADAKNVIRTWDLLSGRELVKLQGHNSRLLSLALSTDLSSLVSFSHTPSSTIKLWNTKNGTSLGSFSSSDLKFGESEQSLISGATVSADGNRALAWSYESPPLNDLIFKYWDTATGKELDTFRIKQLNRDTLPFGIKQILNPDANTLVILGYPMNDTQTVWVVDIETGDILNTVHAPRVLRIACSDDAQELLIVSSSEKENHMTVSLRKTHIGTDLWSRSLGIIGSINDLVIGPTGEHFAITNGQQVNVGKMSDGSIRLAYQHYQGDLHMVNQLGFSPDATRLVCGYEDGATRIWPLEDTYQTDLDHDPTFPRLLGHKGHVNQVQFSSDSRRLYSSSSQDKTVRIWDVKTHKEIMSLDGSVETLSSFAVSPDDSLIAILSGSEKPTISIWDLKKRRKILDINDLPQKPVGSIQFTKDGKSLICAIVSRPGSENEKERIKIWSVADGTLVRTIPVDQFIRSASLSPDEKVLLVCGTNVDSDFNTEYANSYAGLVSFSDGSEIVRFSGHQSRISIAKFSPDGQRVATGGEDRTLRIWDVATGASLFVLRGHTRPIVNIAFTPDGDRVASAAQFNIVKLWNMENGFEMLSLENFYSVNSFYGHLGGIAFSRNGILAHTSHANDIRIRDARPFNSP